MRRFVTFFLVLFAMSFTTVSAQLPKAPAEMKGKIVTGGNFGLDFYGRSFYLGVSPQVGYRLTPGLEAGVRLGYSLHYYFDSYYGNYSVHHLSAGVYVNYEVIKGLYIHLEDEESCRLVYEGLASNGSDPRYYNSLFVGAGYREYFSEKAYAYISLLYNMRWNYSANGEVNSPYSRPLIVRVGYCVGL